MVARNSILSQLGDQYNDAIESVDSNQSLQRMKYWANRRDTAIKMASSVLEDITVIDIEINLRSK